MDRSPEEILIAMRRCVFDDDFERAHSHADDLLVELIRWMAGGLWVETGDADSDKLYGDILEAYSNVTRYCA